MEFGVTIERSSPVGLLPFKEIFKGFEGVPAVMRTFGPTAEIVLGELMVDVQDSRGYLHIDDERGCIVINMRYLNEGEDSFLYLDVIHELVHIKQLMEGRELFDRSYAYVDRPTEIEAYLVTVQEARRIGFTDRELVDYLRVEWVSEEDFHRLLATLGVEE